MSRPIEDYALIGDLRTAALVARDGSIDWFCPPRFDAPACFAALLGDQAHGFWRLAPDCEVRQASRCYLTDTLILCSEWGTAGGRVRVLDFMPLGESVVILRLVEGLEGQVPMRMQLRPRFGYGKRAGTARLRQDGLLIGEGQGGLLLRGDVQAEPGDAGECVALFEVTAGQRLALELVYSELEAPLPPPAETAWARLDGCRQWWREWVERCSYRGRWRDAVVRSLITLKALSHAPSGSMVAAPTTSLPERPGGEANWDYRFCWIRDAVLALDILLDSNYPDEAAAWQHWLHQVVDRDGQLRVLYDVEGQAPPAERCLDWLPGYHQSQPVRVGNAARGQHQLDLYGQLLDLLHIFRRSGLSPSEQSWRRQCALLDHLTELWQEPDDGIWELRGRRRHYTHSKIYAWVAFDRSIRDAETFSLPAPLERWRIVRDEIHADICTRGVDPARGAFCQSYDDHRPDASLLMAPLLGFLPAEDVRIQATLTWIEERLLRDGLVWRFEAEQAQDDAEGAFLACSFWLVDNWLLVGRAAEARALFEKLLGLRNDLGLLAEQYQPGVGQLGNFPQALSHLALIKSAYLLEARDGVHEGGEPERHSYHPVDDG